MAQNWLTVAAPVLALSGGLALADSAWQEGLVSAGVLLPTAVAAYSWGVHTAARDATIDQFAVLGPTDQVFVRLPRRPDVQAVWRAMLREFWLPALLAMCLLLAEASAILRIGDWLTRIGAQPGFELPTRTALAAAILATLGGFWTRRGKRIALCDAVATELFSSSHLVSQAGSFAYARRIFLTPHAGRPIVVAALRPYLFIDPERESRVDLPTELLGPLVHMVHLEHGLSMSWEQFGSQGFFEADAARRERYIGVVEKLWNEYERAAQPALFRIAYYSAARRWFPL